MKKRLLSETGSAFLWTLCIFVLLTVISTALLTAAMSSFAVTNLQKYNRQSYFTACSAVRAMANYIQKGGTGEVNTLPAGVTNIDNLDSPGVNISGTTNIVGSGTENGSNATYKVAAWYTDNTKANVKIKATATQNKETSTVTAVLTYTVTSSPLDYMMYLNSSYPGVEFNFTGDLFINGPATFTSGSSINGNIYSTGDVTFTGGASTVGGSIYSLGNISLLHGAKISTAGGGACNVFAQGNFSIDGQSSVTGNVVTNGNYTNTDNSCKITGSLSYYGSIANVATITGGVTQLNTKYDVASHVAPFDFSQSQAQIVVPTQAQNPQLYTNIPNSTTTISSDGILTQQLIDSTGYTGGYRYLTVDITKSNVSLLINSSVNIGNTIITINYSTSNSYKLYIYLTDSGKLIIGDGVDSGFVLSDKSVANNRFFIMGNGAQSVTVNSGNCINGYIYLPNGSVTLNGGDYGGSTFPSYKGFKLIGNLVAKTVSLASNDHIKYLKPVVTSTPLQNIGKGTYSMGSWSGS